MKTTNLKHRASPTAEGWLGLVRGKAALGSALLLAAGRLLAMPTVTTVSGGPTAGFVDGDTAAFAMFNTPAGLALDKDSTHLYVADRGKNAIRQLDLAGNQTITFATYGVNVPVGLVVNDAGNVFLL